MNRVRRPFRALIAGLAVAGPGISRPAMFGHFKISESAPSTGDASQSGGSAGHGRRLKRRVHRRLPVPID